MYIRQMDGKDGLPVVFLHGFLETGEIWTNWLSASPLKNPVFIPDLPGHGKSTTTPLREGFSDWGKYIKEYIDVQLPAKKEMVVVGHSMGGYLAMEMAALFPEAINKIILFHSTPMPDSSWQITRRKKQILAIERGKGRLLTSNVGPAMFAPENRNRLELTGKKLNKNARACSAKGMKNTLQAIMQRRNFEPVLKEHMNNTLLITGDRDPFMPTEHAFQISSKFPGLRHIHLTNCGHAAFLEHPEVTLKEFNAFLNI